MLERFCVLDVEVVLCCEEACPAEEERFPLVVLLGVVGFAWVFISIVIFLFVDELRVVALWLVGFWDEPAFLVDVPLWAVLVFVFGDVFFLVFVFEWFFWGSHLPLFFRLYTLPVRSEYRLLERVDVFACFVDFGWPDNCFPVLGLKW